MMIAVEYQYGLVLYLIDQTLVLQRISICGTPKLLIRIISVEATYPTNQAFWRLDESYCA